MGPGRRMLEQERLRSPNDFGQCLGENHLRMRPKGAILGLGMAPGALTLRRAAALSCTGLSRLCIAFGLWHWIHVGWLLKLHLKKAFLHGSRLVGWDSMMKT